VLFCTVASYEAVALCVCCVGALALRQVCVVDGRGGCEAMLHLALGLTVQVGYTAAVMYICVLGGRVRVCVRAFV
jgi:hypothetical protein